MRTQSKNKPTALARENAGDQVVIGFSLHLIGWKSGANFLDQSQGEVKQKQNNPGLISTLSCKLPLNPLTPKSDKHLNSPYEITPRITRYGHENRGNDHKQKKLLIGNQILLVSILGNVYRAVWRICILILGLKRLNAAR